MSNYLTSVAGQLSVTVATSNLNYKNVLTLAHLIHMTSCILMYCNPHNIYDVITAYPNCDMPEAMLTMLMCFLCILLSIQLVYILSLRKCLWCMCVL